MQATTRRGPGRPKGTLTLEASLAAYLLDRAAELEPPVDDGRTWPSKKYQHDIIAFCYEILGAEHLTKTQRKVLLAIQRAAHTGARVAVKAGRKVGKTWLAAAAALWFYCSFARAAVWLTAPKIDQVDDLVWREIREACRKNAALFAQGKVLALIDGTPAISSETGLVAADDRLIKGRVARTQEGAQGYSGRQFYIVDEASGVSQEMMSAIEGNRAGGNVPLLMIANPTQTEGELYDAFHSKKELYGNGDPELGPFTISSEESPNFIEDRIVIEGMATRQWIREMEKIHGRDSAWFRVNVLGEFAEGEFGKIIKLAAIMAAQDRFRGAVDEAGPLVIGLDVAGPGPGGDKTVYAPRRGKRVRIHAHERLTEDGIVENLLGYVRLYGRGTQEQALVVLDADGEIGAKIKRKLLDAAEIPKNQFRVLPVRSGEDSEWQPRVYPKIRDELWAKCAEWLAAGGALPDDAELAQELHAPSWFADDKNRQFATKKKDLRKQLGRSPDKADAVCLSTWAAGHEHAPSARRYDQGAIEELRDAIVSPHGNDEVFDPYRGVR